MCRTKTRRLSERITVPSAARVLLEAHAPDGRKMPDTVRCYSRREGSTQRTPCRSQVSFLRMPGRSPIRFLLGHYGYNAVFPPHCTQQRGPMLRQVHGSCLWPVTPNPAGHRAPGHSLRVRYLAAPKQKNPKIYRVLRRADAGTGSQAPGVPERTCDIIPSTVLCPCIVCRTQRPCYGDCKEKHV